MKCSFKSLYISIFVTIILAGNATAGDMYNQIQNKTFDLFKQKLNVSADELKITYTYLPEDLNTYPNATLKVYSQKNRIRPGSQAVWVEITDNGRLLEKFPVTVDVNILKDVVVAEKRINRGTKLSEFSLKMEKRLLGKYWQDYFFSLAELAGCESKQLIKSGLPVTKRMVRQIPLVQRGQTVRLEIHTKTFTLSCPGIAREDGLKGEKIKIKLEESGNMISGVVTSENRVVVYQE